MTTFVQTFSKSEATSHSVLYNDMKKRQLIMFSVKENPYEEENRKCT